MQLKREKEANSQTQKEKENLVVVNQQLKSLNNKITEDKKQLEKQRANLNEIIKKANSRIKQIEKERDDLKAAKSKTQSNKDKLEKERNELKAAIDRIQSQKERLEIENNQLKQQLTNDKSSEKLEKENFELKKENARMQSEKEQLQRQINELKAISDKAQSAKAKLEKENNNLKTYKEQSERENNDLIKSKEQLQKENNEFKTISSKAQSANAKLERENNDLKKFKEQLQKENKDIKASKAQLEREYNDLQKSKAKLQNENDKFSILNNKAEEDKEQLVKENNMLVIEKAQLESINTELKEENDKIKANQKHLETEIIELKAVNDKLIENQKRLEKEINELKAMKVQTNLNKAVNKQEPLNKKTLETAKPPSNEPTIQNNNNMFPGKLNELYEGLNIITHFQTNQRGNINVVFLGHFNSGKSTTVGHLVWSCGGVAPDVMERIEKEAKQYKKYTCKFPLISDSFQQEREKGMTMEVSYLRFETSQHKFTIIDVPGNRDCIKNTIKGTSQADASVLVVNASYEAEAGISVNSQTREHALLAYAFNIRQIIVAVNHMDDKKINYNQQRFEEVRNSMLQILLNVGFTKQMCKVVPISSSLGDNLTSQSSNLSWWKGGSLLDMLNSLQLPTRPSSLPLRVSVQRLKIAEDTKGIVGHVESGIIRIGQQIIFAPSNSNATVVSLEMRNEKVNNGFPGDRLSIGLSELSKNIQPGQIFGCANRSPPCECVKFTAKIVVLLPSTKITLNKTNIYLHCHSTHTQCKFVQFIRRNDRSYAHIIENPKRIISNDIVTVVIESFTPVVIEEYQKFPKLGCFAITEKKQIIAVGIVTEVLK